MKKIYSLFVCLAAFTFNAQAQGTPQPDKTGMDLTAKEWNSRVIAGWNLGNSLESAPTGWDGNSTNISWTKAYDNSETGWGNPKTTQVLIDSVKAAGFNAIRIPIRWACHITNATDMTISETWLKRVKEVVDYCLKNDMYVIINTHHDMWLEYQATSAMKATNNARLAKLWTNIASYFADYDGRLAFAGTNETHLKDNWNAPAAINLEVQNSYLQTFIDAVRATGGKNYYRHLIFQTYACNPYFGLDNQCIIPKDVEENGYQRMSVEFHYYNPYNYCSGEKGSGYYNYWGNQYTGTQKTAIAPDNEKTMTDFFDKVDTQWSALGLGIVVGEWGISDRYTSSLDKKAIHDNMTYYCSFLTKEVRNRGYSAFVWDNNVFGNGTEKFGIIKRSTNKVEATWIMDGIKEGIKNSSANIQLIENFENHNEQMYDLLGRPVSGQTKGLIIRNGRKYIIK